MRLYAGIALVLLAVPATALVFPGEHEAPPHAADDAQGQAPPADATFSTPVRVTLTSMFEPSVRVDRAGVIYVAAARGLTAVSPVYRSEDGGVTWTRLPGIPGNILLGAEPEICVTESDDLLYTDLWAGNVVVARYTDHGRTLAGWNLIAQTSTVVDRNWQACGAGDEMFMNTYDLGRGSFQYWSPDPILVPATKPKSIVSFSGPSPPPAFDPTTGFVYQAYGEFGTSIWVARTSADPLQVNAAKFRVANIDDPVNQFAVTAVDKEGNVYVAWSSPTDPTNYDVYVAVSQDRGFTWSLPVKVTSGGNNVYPWIDAGQAGRVAVVWYHTPAPGNPEQNPGPWRVQFGQSIDMLSAAPTFKVTTLPHVVQEGFGICLSGTGCTITPTGNRALGDYFQVSLDEDGWAHVAYAAAINGRDAKVYHTKQVSGTPS